MPNTHIASPGRPRSISLVELEAALSRRLRDVQAVASLGVTLALGVRQMIPRRNSVSFRQSCTGWNSDMRDGGGMRRVVAAHRRKSALLLAAPTLLVVFLPLASQSARRGQTHRSPVVSAGPGRRDRSLARRGASLEWVLRGLAGPANGNPRPSRTAPWFHRADRSTS